MRSWFIAFIVLLVPLGLMPILVYAILAMISSLGIAPGFAAGYITTLQNTLMTYNTIFFLAAGLTGGGIILRSFQTNVHPVFALVGLFLGMPLVIYGTSYISNLFQKIIGHSFLSSAANQFTPIVLFFQNNTLITAVFLVIVLLIMVGGSMRR